MRTDLKDGDILLYHVLPSDKLDIQRLISLGEEDGSGADYRYYHAALVMDAAHDRGFEMNPPCSAYTSLSAQEWDRIDVFRPTVPLDVVKLLAWCRGDIGTAYPYGQILKFLEADIAAEVTGLSVLEKWLDAPFSANNPHWEVCSATVAAALDAASNGMMGWTKPNANERPCDLTAGNVILIAEGQ